MKKRIFILVTGTAVATLLSACAARSPSFDRHYGATLPVLRAQQTANVNAPTENRNRGVEGLDGRAARESLDRYYRTFSEPPPEPPVFSIGIGEDGR